MGEEGWEKGWEGIGQNSEANLCFRECRRNSSNRYRQRRSKDKLLKFQTGIGDVDQSCISLITSEQLSFQWHKKSGSR